MFCFQYLHTVQDSEGRRGGVVAATHYHHLVWGQCHHQTRMPRTRHAANFHPLPVYQLVNSLVGRFLLVATNADQLAAQSGSSGAPHWQQRERGPRENGRHRQRLSWGVVHRDLCCGGHLDEGGRQRAQTSRLVLEGEAGVCVQVLQAVGVAAAVSTNHVELVACDGGGGGGEGLGEARQGGPMAATRVEHLHHHHPAFVAVATSDYQMTAIRCSHNRRRVPCGLHDAEILTPPVLAQGKQFLSVLVPFVPASHRSQHTVDDHQARVAVRTRGKTLPLVLVEIVAEDLVEVERREVGKVLVGNGCSSSHLAWGLVLSGLLQSELESQTTNT